MSTTKERTRGKHGTVNNVKTYEVNFYPTENGDGIYKNCRTKSEAIKEFKRLQKTYPDRTGDAFIRVWKDYNTPDEEPVYDIEL